MSPSQKKAIITAAEKYVREKLRREKTGHDWQHIERVRRVALHIAAVEKADPFLVELMALLHDVSDRKVAGTGNEKKIEQEVAGWLRNQKLSQAQIDEILYVIANQSYSVSGVKGLKLASKAGRVMQDADRLDALGAIGVARCFAYIGKIGNPLYAPKAKIRQKFTTAAYKKDDAAAINHFYEKLFKLKDLMNTKTAKRIAIRRHKFMEKFVKEFLADWNTVF